MTGPFSDIRTRYSGGEGWRSGPTATRTVGPADAPILVVGVELDPATPYQPSVQMVRQLLDNSAIHATVVDVKTVISDIGPGAVEVPRGLDGSFERGW